MTPQKLLLLPICLALLSCSSNSSDEPIPQIIDDETSATQTFTISLKGENTTSTTESQLVYRLYGYDPTLADVAATLLLQRVIGLKSLPTVTSLEWPNDAASAIRPPVTSAGNAKFYLNLQVDLDMDGQICNGDLGQDYSITDFFTLDGVPDETIEFYLETINQVTEDCEGY